MNEFLVISPILAVCIFALTSDKPEVKGVVLDGSNIIHGGARNKTQDTDGHRLLSAMKKFRVAGFHVIALVRKQTIDYMTREESPGIDIILNLIESGEIIMFEQDDPFLLEICADKRYFLITNDTFQDNGKERERTLLPHLPWDLIDSLTLGTEKVGDRYRVNDYWRVIESDFYCPFIAPLEENLIEA